MGIAKNLTRLPSRGQIAFGKKIKGNKAIANSSDEDIIRSMIRLRAQGCSLRKIAAWLDAKGVKTKNRKARWQAATVMKILRHHQGNDDP